MTGLLDLVDEHRAAVKYDLLAHGFRLEWLGTSRLPWGDAVTIITQQPTDRSAVYRETHPDLYDRDKKLERLEMIAVLVHRGNLASMGYFAASGVEIDSKQLPVRWDDLFDTPPEEVPVVELMTFAEIAARMGPDWNADGR